jgi:hypothetical protein
LQLLHSEFPGNMRKILFYFLSVWGGLEAFYHVG